ncbi:MAG: class I SAM-dependent methyltransferase [Halopenitus sp.]
MTSWDERFRDGAYPERPEPSPVLRHYVDSISDDPGPGRALDVATGTGRNAVFLAAQGYEVDALDSSAEGLRIAREHADARDVASDCNWIQADATEYAYPENEYDVVTISFFKSLDRLADVKASLAPGGLLFYHQHLRSSDPLESGPSTDRYRFAANELLRACLDLTVLHYEEGTRTEDGRTGARALIVARNSTGGAQSYPPAYQQPE